MMLKVTLVISNSRWFGKRRYQTWLPAAPILTAILREACDFSIIDANVNEWDFEQTETVIRASKADVVLISALSVDYHKQYHKAAEIAKKALPSCVVIMGGVYPTVMEVDILEDEHVDYVFVRHAEGRLDRFIRLLDIGDHAAIAAFPGVGYRKDSLPVLNPLLASIGDVEKQIRPDYSKLDIESYLAAADAQYNPKNYSTECSVKRSVNITTSYGCRYNCFFCATRTISGRKIAYRSVEDVLDEICFFVTHHRVNHISFMDDNVVSDKARAKALLAGIQAMGVDLELQVGNLAVWDLDASIIAALAAAGCTRVGISIESSSQRVLHKIIHKPLDLKIVKPIVAMLREAGMMVVADFIIGLPGETWQEIKDSFRYAAELDIDLCNFNVATPYPKTDLYKHMVANDMLPKDFSFTDDKFFLTGIPSTDEFTAAELKVLQAFGWEDVNCGTLERRERTKRVLRLDDQSLNDYCRSMRHSAIRSANYCLRGGK